MALITDMQTKKPIKTRLGTPLVRNALKNPGAFAFDQLQIGDQVFNKSDNFAGLGELSGLGVTRPKKELNFGPGIDVMKTPVPPKADDGLGVLRGATGTGGGTTEFDLGSFLGTSFDPQNITEQKQSTLGVVESLIGASEQELAERRRLADEDIDAKLARQAELLEKAFAPKISSIREGGEKASGAAAFSAAARGSVRGSRQAERQVEIAEKTAQAVAAVEAEKALQLQLREAQLRGASEEQLQSLSGRIADLRGKREQLQQDVELAKEGLLAEQNQLAQEAKERQLSFVLDRLAEQGMTIDPFTGQTVSTAEGEERKAEIALKDAKTAEIYRELQKPNVQVKYFSDELGNVTANVFNLDTGSIENVELGKLDAATKWAIDALEGGQRGSAVPAQGFTPGQAGGLSKEELFQEARQIIDGGGGTETVLGSVDKLKNAGFTEADINGLVTAVQLEESNRGNMNNVEDFFMGGLGQFSSPITLF